MKVLHFLGIGRVPKRPMIDATGGTERVALEIARIQANRGHRVTIASMASSPWQGHWDGIRLIHLQPFSWAKFRFRGRGRDLRAHLRLSAFVHTGMFDVIHLHEYFSTRLFPHKASVMQFHNNPLDGSADTDLIERAPDYWRAVGRGRAQIAVSGFVAERLRLVHRHAGIEVTPANIVVNPSGVDTMSASAQECRRARAQVRADLGVHEDDVVFMFAGAVRREKGIIQLAQAFARLSAAHPRAHLVIAGGAKLWLNDSGDVDDTELQARSILDDSIRRRRVSMLGIVSPAKLTSYYAAADVFVLPSICQETFGLVVLEAFAAGLPVVATRSGGLPELVQDRANGLLADPGDVDGLHDAMRDLLIDPDMRAELGRAAREFAANCSWERTVDRLEQIYAGAGSRSKLRTDRSGHLA